MYIYMYVCIYIDRELGGGKEATAKRNKCAIQNTKKLFFVFLP